MMNCATRKVPIVMNCVVVLKKEEDDPTQWVKLKKAWGWEMIWEIQEKELKKEMYRKVKN